MKTLLPRKMKLKHQFLGVVICTMGILALAGKSNAAVIISGVITPGLSDLLPGQSDTGPGGSGNTDFNFRYSYGSFSDAYYQNSGTGGTPDQSGLLSATAGSTPNFGQFIWQPGVGAVGSLDGAAAAGAWAFDLSNVGTITKLVVRMTTWYTGAGGTNLLEITPEGGSASTFESITATSFATAETYYDLTSQVAGLSGFTLGGTVFPGGTQANTMLFVGGPGFDANREFAAFDVQITIIPEPTTAAYLIGGCGLVLLSYRRRWLRF